MGPRVLTAERQPFPRLGSVLHCGSHSLETLADEHDTPLYVYDGDRVLERLGAVHAAFAGVGLLVAYSVKANPNLALLKLLAGAGAGADIVSGGELYCALEVGIAPGRIVFAGVGKTRAEMRYALESRIRGFHVESPQELEVLAAIAREVGAQAPVAVRVNPDVDSPTHEFTRTGHAAAKFGVSPRKALDLYRRIAGHSGLRAVGVDVHIGSQVREPGPFLRALDVVLEVAERAHQETGAALEYVDLGGGFGIEDAVGGEIDLRRLGREVAARIAAASDRTFGRPLTLIVEPGRFLVGDAGVLLTRVLYVKRSGGKTFVVTDAGMTELIRPSHYGGEHAIVPVREDGHGGPEEVDIVGPVCEQGDFLARDRRLPLPRPGALLCVQQAGAYAFAMASNYNSRPRPAEVLVHGGRATLVRRRERYSDLVRGQRT